MRVGQLGGQVQPEVGVVLDVAVAEVDEQTTRLETIIIILVARTEFVIV